LVKTEENLIGAIEALNDATEQFHYADVAEIAETLVEGLKRVLKTAYVSLCGEVRRQATTVSRIELIAVSFPKSVKAAALRRLFHISSKKGDVTEGHTEDEIPVTIYHVQEREFFWHLFLRTGNPAHISKVRENIRRVRSYKDEQSIYAAAKLPFIVPEMREDVAEWEYAKHSRPLTEVGDIRGVVHNHTTYSDGVDRLEDFVAACRRQQFEYVVISDHSKNAHYAGGLKEEKVLRQLARIEELNREMAPFRIFKSIECDILVSGELDFPKALLKKFDLVIVSIHQQLKMSEDKATARIIRAIENPATTILGHMTGRQLLVRPGYPLNFKKVIDACAANHVVIEVNANPYRLDMDWSHIPYALKKGVMISINPDAHSIAEIDNIQWGVCAARKGGLTKASTWNAMPLKKIGQWLRQYRKI
jgi:DNA polymerase (family 10)